ncbi:hypothetical protein B0H19DRAFT_1065819 [Mycena capillaripes]|nr:hypothetical protein B0H19DRAFT_1065819 [Mycena capillaripes]
MKIAFALPQHTICLAVSAVSGPTKQDYLFRPRAVDTWAKYIGFMGRARAASAQKKREATPQIPLQARCLLFRATGTTVSVTVAQRGNHALSTQGEFGQRLQFQLGSKDDLGSEDEGPASRDDF